MEYLFQNCNYYFTLRATSLLGFMLLAISAVSLAGTVAQTPLFLKGSADANVLFNMSVETPMGGAAYNDQPGNPRGCLARGNDGGEVGTCYFRTTEYLGYFNPNTCYVYTVIGTPPAGNTGYFTPSSRSDANHQCLPLNTMFSGNFLNWATMTATDMFVKTMTGGNRINDGADTTTIVRRARKINNDSWFPHKIVSKTSLNLVDPRTVTPFNRDKVFIYNTDFVVQFDKNDRGGSDLGFYNVDVRVCQKSTATPTAFDLEANCIPYSNAAYYKPEGLIQRNAEKMRFGVTSYTSTDGNGIDGGVLRANMKYVGAIEKNTTTGEAIPNTGGIEINADGTLNLNPNSADAAASGVVNSGVIPYLNKFSQLHVYKSNDPASELFYESLRYFKHKGPTPEYLAGANGGFPILNSARWQDPILYSCQKNFIIGMNDANPWMDKKLPGTYFTANKFHGVDISQDFGQPSNPDPDINVRALTNRVGVLEKLKGTSQCVGYTDTNFDGAATNKVIPNLGEVMGTCPGPGKFNSYYIAGLAHYANITDLRPDIVDSDPADDIIEKQTVNTFMIDTQEYSTSPLLGRMNMLWLAGKYGGFTDTNDNGIPDDAVNTTEGISEWDADKDSQPDNYVLATQPENLVKALNNAFVNIQRRSAASSSVAANSTQYKANALIFQALFSAVDWGGELRAIKLLTEDTNGNGKLDPGTPGDGEDTNGNGVLDNGLLGGVSWNASEHIPLEPPGADGGRHIFSYNPQSSASAKGIEFLWGNLNSTQKTALDSVTAATAATTSPVVDYLRGNRIKETTAADAFRKRSVVLGDIVNSDPLYVAGQDLGYATATSFSTNEKTTYPAYLAAKQSNPELIYVGANDGMLHAFDASASSSGGKEIFAYVPNAVISPELATLTNANYVHKYFVDGAPQFGDAFFSDNNWHSVLVGSMGAGTTTVIANPDANGDGNKTDPSLETGTGGRSVFALDITSPSSFNQTKVLWEFSNRQDSPAVQPRADVDLGYTIPVPSVVRMNDGKWRVIVANGYNSPSGKAVLFILDAETGVVVKKFIAEDKLGGNGLSNPTPVDADGDKIIDYIYAGDLKGNMWKFDVTASTPGAVIADNSLGTWKIAFSPVQSSPPTLDNVPVFTACYTEPCSGTNRQPITAKAAVIKATAAGQPSGFMIYYGTGKYFEDGDHTGFTTSPIDAFYGIWDKCDKSTPVCSGSVSSRSQLQRQTITNEFKGDATLSGGVASSRKLRVTSNCEVAYGATTPTTTLGSPCNSVTNRFGWFMNLIPPSGIAEGERVVNTAIVRNNVVIFTTLIPISSPCKPDGTGWLMEVSTTGARFSGSNFDANKDGKIDDNDMVVLSDGTKVAATGLGSEVGIIDSPVIVDTGNEDTKFLNGSNVSKSNNNGIMDIKESPKCTGVGCPPPPGGGLSGSRDSWRQLR